MERILKQRVRLAAFAALGGILALVVAMQLIFARVTKEDDWVEHAHRVRFLATSVLVSVFRAVDSGADPAGLHILLSSPSLPGTVGAQGDPLPAGQTGRWDPPLHLLGELEGLVRDNPDQTHRVQALRGLIDAHREQVGDKNEDPDRVAFLEAVKDAVAIIHLDETHILQRRVRQLERLRWLFIGGSIGISLIAGALTWWQWRGALGEVSREEAMRAQLQAMLADKTALLREVNHRVGNGLATTAMLLHLQARHTQDPQASHALTQARRRTQALSQVHRHLLQMGAVDRVSYAALLPGLLADLADDLGTRVEVTLDGRERTGQISVDAATALALILHEVMGAVRDLDADIRTGLDVRLVCRADGVVCQISDAAGRLRAIPPFPGGPLPDVDAPALAATATTTGTTGGTPVDVRSAPSPVAAASVALDTAPPALSLSPTALTVIATLAHQIGATLTHPIPGYRWDVRLSCVGSDGVAALADV